MKFIADFHLHSRFSRATSADLTLENLERSAQKKGIDVVGTADFTHPEWQKELQEKLEVAGDGIFQLKGKYKFSESKNHKRSVSFMLTTELSTIYKKNGKVRRVHSLIFASDFETIQKITNALQKKSCNLHSDGRPILGMDTRDLLELCLTASPEIFFVPAHIWTPHFSILGKNSGFDSIEECFEDLTSHITTLEMGLSSDPFMNWGCSYLDKYTFIANSDAHSSEKLGRNANIFTTEKNYTAMITAMKTGNPELFWGTINGFPEASGKYHFDGHRSCQVCWSPEETKQHQGICSVCHKPVTTGVLSRVLEFTDRKDAQLRLQKNQFVRTIPIKEILANLWHTNEKSKKIETEYERYISIFGTEFFILLEISVDELSKQNKRFAEAIDRIRKGQIQTTPGYDGEFGSISLFP